MDHSETPILEAPADYRKRRETSCDAFFSRTEQVPLSDAVGRISAEMLTPYPPGIPAVMPGERITSTVLEYLHSGVKAGMVVPDAVDSGLETVRVMA
ncbi:Orn/Lys/Arg family decarboxylase [Actinocorallia populi]|uniref:Orn/Lys/Arg family decarboxylase n=1 Tax=Actinocorallia populi TaxID=2079200 RepID=UPI000D095495|nr:hypothetical protein [Actinocorallia populi]